MKKTRFFLWIEREQAAGGSLYEAEGKYHFGADCLKKVGQYGSLPLQAECLWIAMPEELRWYHVKRP